MQCLVNKPNEAYASATKRKIFKILKCGEDQYTNDPATTQNELQI